VEHSIGSQLAHDQSDALWIKPPSADDSQSKMTSGANLTRIGRKLPLDHDRRLLARH
jgi:hypothetical protein